jgi:hypothetical protein
MNAQMNAVLPADFQDKAEEAGVEVKKELVPSTINNVLVGHAPLALVLLGQINFRSGVEMMKRLKHDMKNRKNADGSAKKNEDDIHPDKTVSDALESMMASVEVPLELTKTLSLMTASVVLAHKLDIGDDNNLKFIRDGILSPMKFIDRQNERATDFQTELRLAQAQRFGSNVTADQLKKQLAGQRQEFIADYKAEVAHAIDYAGIMGMEFEELVDYISEAYDFREEWKEELVDRVVSMFNNAKDKLEKGWLVDMDDTLIMIAREALEAKAK